MVHVIPLRVQHRKKSSVFAFNCIYYNSGRSLKLLRRVVIDTVVAVGLPMPTAVWSVGRGGGQSHSPDHPRPPSLLAGATGYTSKTAATWGASAPSSTTVKVLCLVPSSLRGRQGVLGGRNHRLRGRQGRLGLLRWRQRWRLRGRPHDSLDRCCLGLCQPKLPGLFSGPSGTSAAVAPPMAPLWRRRGLWAGVLFTATVEYPCHPVISYFSDFFFMNFHLTNRNI